MSTRSPRQTFRPGILAAILLLFLTLLLCHTTPINSAPLPAPRGPQITPASIAGEWSLTWNDVQAPCELERSGKWGCWWKNESWQGTWDLTGDVLTVRLEDGFSGAEAVVHRDAVLAYDPHKPVIVSAP